MLNISQGCHLEVVLGAFQSYSRFLFALSFDQEQPPCDCKLVHSLKHLLLAYLKDPVIGKQSENRCFNLLEK